MTEPMYGIVVDGVTGETTQVPLTEEELAERAEWKAQAPAAHRHALRYRRDQLLAETDWWVVADRTATAEQLAYRQALRDLPANTVDPANPVWPTKP